MQQFKISTEGIDKIISNARLRTILTCLIGLTAGVVIFANNSQDKEGTTASLPFIIPFLLAVAVWAYLRGIKRQKALLATFTIVVNDHTISRQQLNTTPVLIDRNDIKEIIKDKKGNLVIKGAKRENFINVPAQIDHFAELETILHQIKPISERNPYSIIERYPLLAGLIAVALMLSVYLSSNKIVVGITGALLLAIMTWSFINVQRNPHIDDKIKKRFYFVLLVMASILATMIMKLGGYMGY